MTTKFPLSHADEFVASIDIAGKVALAKFREGGLDSVTRAAVVEARKNPKLVNYDVVAALVVAAERGFDIGEAIVGELSA